MRNHPMGAPRVRRRTKLLFSLVTVLLALALLEGVSRLFVQLAPNARWEYRCKLAEGLGFPALNDLFLADEELFWKTQPNLRQCPFAGRFGKAPPLRFSVSTDERGLRRSPPVDVARYRILFLGDSCTFGLGVEDHETFPALLQERLNDVQCINAAVSGYTAYQGRRLLERLESDASLHIVVIAFGRNDDLVWDNRSDIEHGELLAVERSRFSNRVRFVHLLRLLLPKRRSEASAPDGPCRPRLTDAEFAEQVRAMIGCCRERGAEPILLIWPERSQMLQAQMFSKQIALANLARSESVRIVDLIRVFRACGKTALFLDAIHANPAGCRVAADALRPVLQDVLTSSSGPTAQP